MAFDWALYLGIARSLASQAGDEAALRSAVSRAYYAAFGVAAARMRTEGQGVPTTGEAHQVLWKYFESANDRFRRKIGQDGRRLRYRRTTADYDGSRPISISEVTDSLRSAESLIRFVGMLK
jgi:uncharacterized protein (UPF0332 family)